MKKRCPMLWKNLYVLLVANLLQQQKYTKSLNQKISFYYCKANLINVAAVKTRGFSVHHATLPLGKRLFLSFWQQTLSILQCVKIIPPNWMTLLLSKSALSQIAIPLALF